MAALRPAVRRDLPTFAWVRDFTASGQPVPDRVSVAPQRLAQLAALRGALELELAATAWIDPAARAAALAHIAALELAIAAPASTPASPPMTIVASEEAGDAMTRKLVLRRLDSATGDEVWQQEYDNGGLAVNYPRTDLDGDQMVVVGSSGSRPRHDSGPLLGGALLSTWTWTAPGG